MQNREIIHHNSDNENIKMPEMMDVGMKNKAEVPDEAKDWMEKINESNEQSDLVQDVIKQAHIKNDQINEENTIKVPVTKKIFEEGFKKPVSEAMAWMSKFFERLFKIKKGKVEFVKDDA